MLGTPLREKTLIQSSISVVEDLTSAEELINALRPHDSRWQPRPHDWVFRGQADARWELWPSALRATARLDYRRGSAPGPRSTHREQVIDEYVSLVGFLKECDLQGLPYPDDTHLTRSEWMKAIAPLQKAAELGEGVWPPPQLHSMLALAQHYGVHTRLLDWTRRPLVGAYFAAVEAAMWCNQPANDPLGATHLAVWAIDQMSIQVAHDQHPYPLKTIRVVVAPPAQIPNLHAQAGIFTLTETGGMAPDNPPDLRPLHAVLVDETAEWTEDLWDHYKWGFPWLRCLRIPLTEAPKLLRLLASEWVSATSLFPGYDGVVRGLRERLLWDRS